MNIKKLKHIIDKQLEKLEELDEDLGFRNDS